MKRLLHTSMKRLFHTSMKRLFHTWMKRLLHTSMKIISRISAFMWKVVFICLRVSVNLVYKFQGKPGTTAKHDFNPNGLKFHRGSPWVSILSWLNLMANKDYFSHEGTYTRYNFHWCVQQSLHIVDVFHDVCIRDMKIIRDVILVDICQDRIIRDVYL